MNRPQIITRVNSKGQVVIPKEYRDLLEITENSIVSFRISGNSINIVLIKDSVYDSDNDQTAYMKLLQKTRGAWGKVSDENPETLGKELKSSEEARKEW